MRKKYLDPDKEMYSSPGALFEQPENASVGKGVENKKAELPDTALSKQHRITSEEGKKGYKDE